MIVTKVVNGLLIVVLVAVVTTRLIECSIQQYDRYMEEISIRAQYKCGEPKPRIIYLHEIVDNETIWMEKYDSNAKNVRPFGVVLHRCNNSGCCEAYNKRCEPLHVETVTLSFMLVVPSADGTTSKSVFEDHEVKNHTKCSCQKIDDSLIKK
ncbi:unnamed protein product [Phyllotreta striolata]|uniref:Platelet-derived growth factor (PDGF) family profile domain-containing protein n=1 Tax=Phyllotreta striolata TaxID=444603 RepID=A0A9N9XLH3_PHYSR|nr:unnamed protein product [Phyllotreta striolata]